MREAWGGWIEVDQGPGEPARTIAGELLAISSDSVYVLATDGFHAAALADVSGGRLEWMNASGQTVRWMLGGAVSTFTHGIGLIVSAPLWLIVGGISSAAVRGEGRMSTKRHTWAQMSAYARFPQGLPVNLDRGALKRRPIPDEPEAPTQFNRLSR